MGGTHALGGQGDGLATSDRSHPDALLAFVFFEVRGADHVGDVASIRGDLRITDLLHPEEVVDGKRFGRLRGNGEGQAEENNQQESTAKPHGRLHKSGYERMICECSTSQKRSEVARMKQAARNHAWTVPEDGLRREKSFKKTHFFLACTYRDCILQKVSLLRKNQKARVT